MNNLSTKQKAFYKKVAEILWEKWVPIGVNDGDNEWNDNYVPHIFRLAIERNDAFRIAVSLTSLVEKNMELGADKEQARIVAEFVVQAKIEMLG